MQLAQLGIGHITANDPQVLEIDNLNRFPIATLAEVGIAKATLIDRYLRHWPHVRYHTLQDRSESPGVVPFYRKADFILCCSNTLASRRACVVAARRFGKVLLDVAVADGRHRLAGSVRIYRPLSRNRLACPMCFLPATGSIRRGEGLLSTAIALTAALAAHLVLVEVAKRVMRPTGEGGNVVVLDLGSLSIERLTVRRNQNCACCG